MNASRDLIERGINVLQLLRDPHFDLRSSDDFDAAAAATFELIGAAEQVLATNSIDHSYAERQAARSRLRAALERVKGGNHG